MRRVGVAAALLSLAGCASTAKPSPSAGPVPATAATESAAATAAPAAAAVAGAGQATERTTPDAPFRQLPPPPGPEPAFHPAPWKRFKLKNGLEVVLVEFHDLPLVDFNLMIKTGGAANPPDRAGLAELCARMLDEGTKTRSALEIADQLAALGATLSAGSSWDASNVSLQALARNLEGALALFADIVQNPAFDAKETARVRDNLITAITRRKDSPPTVANLALARVLYGPKHPYGWPMAGVESSIKAIGPSELRSFYEAYYHPNNATLIVAGDTTEPALRVKVEAAFGKWKSKRAAPRKLPSPAAPTATKIFLVDKADAPQSSIRVGSIGIERASADYFPVTVMNLILGGGFHRLDLNLREGKGWTYGARSTFDSRRTPGPFSAGGEFVAAHTAESVSEILKEVTAMRDADVADAELSRAKDQITKSFPARFATRANVAAQLAELAVFGLPDSQVTEYAAKIAAVTKDDVRRVARKYLDPGHVSIIVVGDKKTLAEPLAKVAPIELRDLDGDPIAEPK